MRIYIINAFIVGALIYGYLETQRRTGVVRRQSWGNVLVDPCKPYVNQTEYEALFTGTGTTSTVLQPWSAASSYIFCVLGLLLIYKEYGEGLAIFLFGAGIGSSLLHADGTDIAQRMDHGFSLLIPLYLGVLGWKTFVGKYALLVGGVFVIIWFQHTIDGTIVANTVMYIIVGCICCSGIVTVIIKRIDGFGEEDLKTIGLIFLSGVTAAVTKYVNNGYLEGTCKNIPEPVFRNDIIHANWHIYSQYFVYFTYMFITGTRLENIWTECVFVVGCITIIIVSSISNTSYIFIFITTISIALLTLLSVVGKWYKRDVPNYSEI